MAAPPFAADVHLVLSNAVAYSPEPDNECHIAAKKHLIAFEEGYFKEGLATDGGAALAAAKAGAKRNSTSRKRARDWSILRPALLVNDMARQKVNRLRRSYLLLAGAEGC